MTSSKFLTVLPRAEDDGTDGVGMGDAGTDAADVAALGRLLAGRLGCELTRRFGAAIGMDDTGDPRDYWRARAALRDPHGFGVAETHALGALVWREAFGALAADWAADGLWDAPYARRVIDAVAHGNAERLYGLG